MALKADRRAPNFTARAHGGREIALLDFKGKAPVVLWFFPLAFGPVCGDELQALERGLGEFTRLGAQVLAVSVDSVFVQNAFVATLGGLGFPVIGDLERRLCSMYEVMRPEGFCERATFAIDAEGMIRWAQVHELAVARDPAAIAETVQEKLAPKPAPAPAPVPAAPKE